MTDAAPAPVPQSAAASNVPWSAPLVRLGDRYETAGRLPEADAARRAAGRVGLLTDRGDAVERSLRGVPAHAVAASKSTPGIRAIGGRHLGLEYVAIDGQLRVDGCLAWRANNPGVLPDGATSRKHGAIGAVDGIAIFPDPGTGLHALTAWLRDTGVGQTIADVLTQASTGAAPGTSPTEDLGPILAALGVGLADSAGTLSANAVEAIANAISMWCDGLAGHVYKLGSAAAPGWVQELARATRPPLSLPLRRLRHVGTVEPAKRYERADNACVISCFFNPCGSDSRKRNVVRFLRSLEVSGLHWRCIECAFGTADFTLPADDRIIRVRAGSVLWQKERLLNLLLRRLPARFEKVAWVDADVLFANPQWLRTASRLLDDYAVVQLFSESVRLSSPWMPPAAESDREASFAYRLHAAPQCASGPYHLHGHTGLAWAGRREWLDAHGLFDVALSGIGDHFMAHGFVGDWSPAPHALDCANVVDGPLLQAFRSWSRAVYPEIRARIGIVEGAAVSLWHGNHADRRYHAAAYELDALGFDPARDLAIGHDGCWEWATPKAALHAWASDYFARRNER